jgi:hypothetical protein
MEKAMDRLLRSLAVTVVIGLSSLTATSFAADRQVSQEKEQQTFYYSWRDYQGNEQKLNFTYSNDQLFNHYRRFKGFNDQEYLDKINVKVMNTIKEFDRRKYRLETTRKERSIEYKVFSDDKALLNEVETRVENAKQSARKSYLKKHYYADLEAIWATDAVRPDLPRFVKESYNYITPIREAVIAKFGNNVRPQTIINFILGWVQSMPASELPDRFHNSGENFKPPLKLIRQEYGDVDSKLVLTSAILKAIYPRLTIAMISTPKHALIGLNLPIRKEDKHIEINGLKYLVGEVSGPKQMPLAEVSSRSWGMLNSKQYIVDII